MRSASVLVLAALLLPLALADGVRDDSSVSVTLPPQAPGHAGATYYVSLCRGDATQPPAVEIVDDCTTSGVYMESNGLAGLQVRAGVDGSGFAYAADKLLAPTL